MKMYQYKVGAIIVFSLLSGTLQGANEMNVSEQKNGYTNVLRLLNTKSA